MVLLLTASFIDLTAFFLFFPPFFLGVQTFMIALLKRITTNQDMADPTGKRVPHYKLK